MRAPPEHTFVNPGKRRQPHLLDPVPGGMRRSRPDPRFDRSLSNLGCVLVAFMSAAPIYWLVRALFF